MKFAVKSSCLFGMIFLLSALALAGEQDQKAQPSILSNSPLFHLKIQESHKLLIDAQFGWTGYSCSFDEESCSDADCTVTDLCCNEAEFENIYESCEPIPDQFFCPEGTIEATAFCRTFNDRWVFI